MRAFARRWWNNYVFVNVNGQWIAHYNWKDVVLSPDFRLEPGDALITGKCVSVKVPTLEKPKSCPLCDDGYVVPKPSQEDYRRLHETIEEEKSKLLGTRKVFEWKGYKVSAKCIAVTGVTDSFEGINLKGRGGYVKECFSAVYLVEKVEGGELKNETLYRFIDRTLSTFVASPVPWKRKVKALKGFEKIAKEALEHYVPAELLKEGL